MTNDISETAKAVVRRNTIEVQGGGNWELFDELFPDDFHDHTPQPGGKLDKAGVLELYRRLREAFPDFTPEIHWQKAEGDVQGKPKSVSRASVLVRGFAADVTAMRTRALRLEAAATRLRVLRLFAAVFTELLDALFTELFDAVLTELLDALFKELFDAVFTELFAALLTEL